MLCKNKLVLLAIIFVVFNQSLEIGAKVNKNGEFLHFSFALKQSFFFEKIPFVAGLINLMWPLSFVNSSGPFEIVNCHRGGSANDKKMSKIMPSSLMSWIRKRK